MKICIIGAGAIGGFMGTKLAISGQNVTFIDQGAQLDAIQEKGLMLIMSDGTRHHLKNTKATGNYKDIGPQDVVILALKSHHIHQVTGKISALFGPKTSVVTIQNGIPWWYFQKHGGIFEGYHIQTLDPDGIIAKNIESDRIIGCIAYPAAEVIEPGVIRHVEGVRFPIGELDGIETQRCKELENAFLGAGLRSRIINNIRSEIWLKAWGTLSFNPISALTHATLVEICQYPETRDLAAKMMQEAQGVANKLGIEFRHTIERRIAGAEGVGAHKTSMLQDVEIGRSLEIEALIGAVIEMGHLTKIQTPTIDAVYACTKLLNKTFTESNAKINLNPI